MMHKSPENTATCTALDQLPEPALDICLSHLDLRPLVRLQACSRWLKRIISSYIRRHAQHMLLQAVLRAAEGGHSQCHKAVAWLLNMLPHAAVAAAISELLTIPNIPIGTNLELQHMGLHPSLEQVVATAAAGVAGTEVWCRTLRIVLGPDPGDLDKGVRVRYVLDELQQGRTALLDLIKPQLPAMLQLTVNNGLQRAARTVVEYITTRLHNGELAAQVSPQFSNPEFIEQLLSVALLRDQQSVILAITHLPGAQQLSAEAAGRLLQKALQCSGNAAAVCGLESLPAMQQLSCSIIVQYLQQAVQAGSSAVFGLLCGLPAAQQIPVGVVDTLVRDILSGWRCSLLEHIPKLQAAQFLGPEAVSQAVIDCLSARNLASASAIMLLPAVSDLDSTQAAKVLQAAVTAEALDVLESLRGRTVAVQHVPVDALVEAASTAMLLDNRSVLAVLGSFAAFQQLCPATLAGLLVTAVRFGSAATSWVCELPTARQLTTETIVQAIQMAWDWAAGPSAVQMLCLLMAKHEGMSAAVDGTDDLRSPAHTDHGEADATAFERQLGNHSMHGQGYQLVKQAVVSGSPSTVNALCQLPMMSLTRGDVYELIGLAIQIKQPLTIQALSKLPAARQLSSCMVAELLLCAVQRGVFDDVVAHALSDLSLDEVTPVCGVQLLKAAWCKLTSSPGANILTVVCALPVLQRMDDIGLVVELLHTAIATNKAHPAVTLIKLPVMQKVDLTTLECLLKSAVRHSNGQKWGTRAAESGTFVLYTLLGLPAAQGLSARCIGDLLSTIAARQSEFQFSNLVHDSSDVVMQLLRCPAACDVAVEALLALMKRAFVYSNRELVHSLYNCPAAARIEQGQLLSLLNSNDVLRGLTFDSLKCIFRLPAARHLSKSDLEGLRVAATRVGNAATVRFLLGRLNS